ncbi:MAG TPA: xanthine dehydrogenase family protein molybdopterin-binding subunit [Syntrophorhabdaceae bacterium]|nr:xanthine dehydrogenase family protein molybdopterin-binding subunit [Syntrophorhabdaceae bacterium]
MYIGNEMNRIDALDKVLGRPVYAEDLSAKGALFGCIFRSTRPHAFIRRIDTRAAMASPGIVKVLSCHDIPGENLFGIIKKDQPYLAQDRVRCIGEPVLIVLGETEEAARKALQLIEVEYEDAEVVSDPFLSEGSTALIHDKGNLLSRRKVIKGDIEKGFKEADVIVEHTYSTSWLDHAFMETESGVGYPDSKGRIVVISSTQNIHYKQKEISRLLAVPEEKIKVVQATTGGGFGGKLDVTVEGFIALSVHHTRRPVVMRFTREESFLSNTKRHPLYIEYKTGARKDGIITAVKVGITGDTGPFASYGETVCLRAALHATGPYEVPNVHVDSRMFYTNNPVSGAMRGFGIPQLAFAHESQMDEVALMLKMDPFDIRMMNALKKGSLTATSQVLQNSVGIIETLKKVEPYWRKRSKKEDHAGFGLGCMYYGIGNTGVSNPANACLNITGDGKIALHTGACEIGQGSDTTLVQILQEALGLKIEDIVLVRGDTDTSKDAGSSSASRQTYISGGAVFDAALKMRQYLDEKGFYKGRPIREIYASEADKKLLEHNGFFDPPTTPVDPETSKGSPYATYAFATHMTEVEVEPETGCCTVKRVYAAHDVGRAINLKNVRGQIYGGIAMGVGFALMEEFVPGKSESFDNYYMPTSMDMPDVEVFVVEDREPTGPFGAKGVGEPALIPQAASIVNAIKDATGVRPFELPCHIERLKMLLEKAKG